MINLDTQVNSELGELPWEIKRRLGMAVRDLEQIQDEKSAKAFCFAWGVPYEALCNFGMEVLSIPWDELKEYFQKVAKSCFWESAVDVYERLIQIVEGTHFSPFIKNPGGYFEYHLTLNDPRDGPVLSLELEPGFKKFLENTSRSGINSFVKDIWEECLSKIPRKKEGSPSYFWHPNEARDPIKRLKFILDDYRSNNYTFSTQKLNDVFRENLQGVGLLPPKGLNADRAKRLSMIVGSLDKINNLNLNHIKQKIDPCVIVDDSTLNRDLNKVRELSESYKKIATAKEYLFSFGREFPRP